MENQPEVEAQASEELEETYGCSHYERKCQINCPTCDEWHTCRICHNEDNVDHELNRFKVSKIKCLQCDMVQSPSNHCQECDIDFAKYYCDICHLWSSSELIYHCDECGICRIGSRDDFKHCKICGACMKIEHECREDLLSGRCSICLENFFDTVKGFFFLPCGHPIHQECFMSYLNRDYRCPVCQKTAVDISRYWSAIAEYIAIEELPSPYNLWETEVVCNDCQHESIVKYHYQFHQCNNCKGFNTQKLRVIPHEDPEEQSNEESEELAILSEDASDNDTGPEHSST